ncbi:hypothetical protein RFI_07636 [Reticulomyxa filosa]|uniref:Uncharacterized protein n=1 Tax=Reticulomyxa filosa TaxID=46433 RepID=X6NUM2_RETFI|nr:hypothetical protein RFI_07636 [Reticulomyxa filosa]|eukprot:ETO29484.1 hypothetical protein RFI_07636 [Reticulomyxa filosa]
MNAMKQISNLRLENCKLAEELRRLKAQKPCYSDIFGEYDKEIVLLHKKIELLQETNQSLTVKNVNLKHKLLTLTSQMSKQDNMDNIIFDKYDLPAFRVLQKQAKELTTKLKEKEAEMEQLQQQFRHTQIRNRVLMKTSKEFESVSMFSFFFVPTVLCEREAEIKELCLKQAETQALADRLQLQLSGVYRFAKKKYLFCKLRSYCFDWVFVMECLDTKNEKQFLEKQIESLEKELIVARKMCTTINAEIKQNAEVERIVKKWYK